MLEYVKSLRWADLLMYSLTDPGAMYRNIKGSEKHAIIAGIPLLFFVALSSALASSLLARQSGFFFYKISYGLILFFLLSILEIIFFAAMMDLYAQISGRRGDISGMISLLIYSSFPKTLLLPITAVFSIMNFAPLFFYFFIVMLLFAWGAYIAVTGISEMHDITFGRSAVIFIFPYLLIGIAGFFILMLSIVCLYGYIFG